MVAYSFKQAFVAPILNRSKAQTIRSDRKRHARPGETMQLYTAMRTKQCRLIGTATCRSIQPLRIEVENAVIGFQSGRTLTTIQELDDFARTDGFPDWIRMRLFWQANHPGTPVFSGVLIRWTDLHPGGGSGEML
jgi:uncharacterized protein YqfB (UPF0267 family)